MKVRKITSNVSILFLLSFFFVLICSESATADVKLPSIISDNMVLQQGMKVSVWGWAEPGEKIKISCSWQRREWKTHTDKNGEWMIKIKPPEKGDGPFEMSVSSSNIITIKNILFGEVWVCSGQSNMEHPIKLSSHAEKEIAEAAYPKMRLFVVKRDFSEEPKTDCEGQWKMCSPETIPDFSAVAYHFGRKIHLELDYPVGLILTAWGGTQAEVWTDKKILEADSDLKPIIDNYEKAARNFDNEKKKYEKKLAEWKELAVKAEAEGKKPPPKPRNPNLNSPSTYPVKRPPVRIGGRNAPGGLYNAMVLPLIPYGIQGVIWYQGESNVWRAFQYRKLFPAMIKNWRSKWGQGKFPFLFVQLANYTAVLPEPGESRWAELREAQLKTLSLPKTGMAVTIDIGDAGRIHPKNKKDVGNRLALWAFSGIYEKKLVYSGPIYKSMKIEGNSIILNFNHIGSGLEAKGESSLKGFAIAGADKKFVWAEAKIVGDTIVVFAEDVAKPAAVRYAWAANPVSNLFNKEGLPASPFRTDDWQGITFNER